MTIRKIVRARVAKSVEAGSTYKDHTNRSIDVVEFSKDTKADFIRLLGEKLVEEAKELQVELLKVADTLDKNPNSQQDIYNLSVLDEFSDVKEVADTIQLVLGADTDLITQIQNHKNRSKGEFVGASANPLSNTIDYYVYTADSHTYHEKYSILNEDKKETK